MLSKAPLHLFYEEPDSDRWFPGDRHPRRIIRRIVRGKPQPGGVMRWFLNLKAGLDQLGVPCKVNDYRSLLRTPGAVAYVVGKPHVIDLIPPDHPIIYGPGIAAHPYESDFWDREEIALVIISCDWFKAMYDRDLPRTIPTAVWPAGIDTDLWSPPAAARSSKVLVYNKIRWRQVEYDTDLVHPIIERLRADGREVVHIRYGHYKEEDFCRLLKEVSAMVFLCEHETQGFAYLQALSSGVPILAWDRGGFWQDPSMYPHRVKFSPVTSVPYFDERCGVKFVDLPGFQSVVGKFLEEVNADTYRPRDYVVENLNLAARAREYLNLVAPFVSKS
jgi:glycosyltransferase involved in cell wall biosynthesis